MYWWLNTGRSTVDGTPETPERDTGDPRDGDSGDSGNLKSGRKIDQAGLECPALLHKDPPVPPGETFTQQVEKFRMLQLKATFEGSCRLTGVGLNSC